MSAEVAPRDTAMHNKTAAIAARLADLQQRSRATDEAAAAVTARKDDAPAADQAAMANVAGWCSISVGGGLIQTTCG